jgi:hypothetical protein
VTVALASAARYRTEGACGPLSIAVRASDDELLRVARSYLELFGPRWNGAQRHIDVQLTRASVAALASATYLSCGRMRVDRRGDHYLAATRCGFVALGACSDGRGDRWIVAVPPQTIFDEPEIGEIEDIFSLICTLAWRAEGWIAVHAGAVVKGAACALLCAASGGGKSTLTAALVQNGWKTLGDDKLLLRSEHRVPVLASMLQTFNLDPATRRWLDVGDIESLPRYSAWTQKRRIHVNTIGENRAVPRATPTHLFVLRRTRHIDGVRATRMQSRDVLPALLRQIVIPSDRQAASEILETAICCARSLRGLYLEIGDDAYAKDGWLAAIEGAVT